MDLITNYWTNSLTSTYWSEPHKDTGNACRTDYLKLVARRQQKSREQTRGLYRKQHLPNTEIY